MSHPSPTGRRDVLYAPYRGIRDTRLTVSGHDAPADPSLRPAARPRARSPPRGRHNCPEGVPMFHLTSGPALMVEVGLGVFCFVDILIAPEQATHWLPRWVWALSVLCFPLGAAIGWIVAGRSWRSRVRSL